MSIVSGAGVRDSWLFYAGRLTRDTARGLLAVLAVIYLAARGFETGEIGWLLGISLAGGFALSMLVMLTVGRLSARGWSVFLALITGVSGVVLIVSDEFWILALGSFVGSYAASGAHWGAMLQLEQTGLARISSAESRTRAFSLLGIASAIGRSLGALLAGSATVLISGFDWSAVDAYRVALVVYVLLNFVSGGIYFLLSSAVEPLAEMGRKSSSGGSSSPLNNPFRARSRRRILSISGLSGLDSFAGGMVFDSFLSFWLFTRFGMSEAGIGVLLVLTQMLNMVSLWAAPWVAYRFGLLNTLLVTQVFSNVALLLFPLMPIWQLACLVWLLRSVFDEMDVPTRQSYMMSIIDSDEHSMMAGSANLGRGLGRIPSATVTGLLWSGSVTVAPWLLAGFLKLVYDAGLYITFRNVKPPEESGRE